MAGHDGAAIENDAGNYASVTVGKIDSELTDAYVWLGDGCDSVSTYIEGGTVEIDGRSGDTKTLLLCRGGETDVIGNSPYTTIEIYRTGVVNYRAVGTITNLNVSGTSSAHFDASKALRAFTATTTTLYGTARLSDPHGKGTYTNGINLCKTGMDGLNLRYDVTLGITYN